MHNRPNFFFVGAPKCGTTALSEYLRTHPQIFISTPKEPHYFATDLPGLRYVTKVGDYERLFSQAGSAHRAIGEASPAYLFSDVAIPTIQAYNPQARLIITLRNPLDLLKSYHAQLVYSLFEDQTNLEAAWNLQEARKSGKHIPQHCREAGLLRYRESIALGTQLKRALTYFPREQVLILFYDDFRVDPGRIYREMLSFLGLDDDGREEFPVVNPQKTSRWHWMNILLHDPPQWMLNAMRGIAGTRMHTWAVSLHGWLKLLNTRPETTEAIPQAMRLNLLSELAPEIELIEFITGRDLSHWKQ